MEENEVRVNRVKSFIEEHGSAVKTIVSGVVLGSSLIGAMTYGMGGTIAESISAAAVTVGGVAASSATIGAFFAAKKLLNKGLSNIKNVRDKIKSREKSREKTKEQIKSKFNERVSKIKEKIGNIDTDALGLGAFAMGMMGLCCYGAGATIATAVAAPLCVAGAAATVYGVAKAMPAAGQAIRGFGQKIKSLFKAKNREKVIQKEEVIQREKVIQKEKVTSRRDMFRDSIRQTYKPQTLSDVKKRKFLERRQRKQVVYGEAISTMASDFNYTSTSYGNGSVDYLVSKRGKGKEM